MKGVCDLKLIEVNESAVRDISNPHLRLSAVCKCNLSINLAQTLLKGNHAFQLFGLNARCQNKAANNILLGYKLLSDFVYALVL